MHEVLPLIELRDIQFLESANALHFVFESGFVIIHRQSEVLHSLLVVVVTLLLLDIESQVVLQLIRSVLNSGALLLLGSAGHITEAAELVLLVRALHPLLPRLGLNLRATLLVVAVAAGIHFVQYVTVNRCLLHCFLPIIIIILFIPNLLSGLIIGLAYKITDYILLNFKIIHYNRTN